MQTKVLQTYWCQEGGGGGGVKMGKDARGHTALVHGQSLIEHRLSTRDLLP